MVEVLPGVFVELLLEQPLKRNVSKIKLRSNKIADLFFTKIPPIFIFGDIAKSHYTYKIQNNFLQILFLFYFALKKRLGNKSIHCKPGAVKRL